MCSFTLATQPSLLRQLQLESPPGKAYENPVSFSKIRLSWGCGNHYPSSFKSLMAALIPALPSGMWDFFWVTIFLVRGSSSGLCLAFLTIIALSPQVREPLWGFCLLLSISIPIVHSRAGERTAQQVQGPTVRRVRPELKLS